MAEWFAMSSRFYKDLDDMGVSESAQTALMRILAYLAEQDSVDGFISDAAVKKLGMRATPRRIDELVSVEVLTRIEHEPSTNSARTRASTEHRFGYQVRTYKKWQAPLIAHVNKKNRDREYQRQRYQSRTDSRTRIDQSSDPHSNNNINKRTSGDVSSASHVSNAHEPPLPPEPPDDDPYVPTEIGTAARPPKPSRATPTEITFLRTHLGGPLPRDTETLLATIVRSHTRQGIPRPHIEAALREWATRDRAAPGLLPNLITDEIKRARTTPTQNVSKADIWTGVANTLHNLEHHNPHQQKAIGQ